VPSGTAGGNLRPATILSTATSCAGLAPTRLALWSLPSASFTVASLAPWMTWKLVTMWPASSQMKPEPVPRGTENTLRVQKSRTCSRVVMNTTESRAFSNRPMVAFSSGRRSPRGATGRGRPSAAAVTAGKN